MKDAVKDLFVISCFATNNIQCRHVQDPSDMTISMFRDSCLSNSLRTLILDYIIPRIACQLSLIFEQLEAICLRYKCHHSEKPNTVQGIDDAYYFFPKFLVLLD